MQQSSQAVSLPLLLRSFRALSLNPHLTSLLRVRHLQRPVGRRRKGRKIILTLLHRTTPDKLCKAITAGIHGGEGAVRARLDVFLVVRPLSKSLEFFAGIGEGAGFGILGLGAVGCHGLMLDVVQ